MKKSLSFLSILFLASFGATSHDSKLQEIKVLLNNAGAPSNIVEGLKVAKEGDVTEPHRKLGQIFVSYDAHNTPQYVIKLFSPSSEYGQKQEMLCYQIAKLAGLESVVTPYSVYGDNILISDYVHFDPMTKSAGVDIFGAKVDAMSSLSEKNYHNPIEIIESARGNLWSWDEKKQLLSIKALDQFSFEKAMIFNFLTFQHDLNAQNILLQMESRDPLRLKLVLIDFVGSMSNEDFPSDFQTAYLFNNQYFKDNLEKKCSQKIINFVENLNFNENDINKIFEDYGINDTVKRKKQKAFFFERVKELKTTFANTGHQTIGEIMQSLFALHWPFNTLRPFAEIAENLKLKEMHSIIEKYAGLKEFTIKKGKVYNKNNIALYDVEEKRKSSEKAVLYEKFYFDFAAMAGLNDIITPLQQKIIIDDRVFFITKRIQFSDDITDQISLSSYEETRFENTQLIFDQWSFEKILVFSFLIFQFNVNTSDILLTVKPGTENVVCLHLKPITPFMTENKRHIQQRVTFLMRNFNIHFTIFTSLFDKKFFLNNLKIGPSKEIKTLVNNIANIKEESLENLLSGLPAEYREGDKQSFLKRIQDLQKEFQKNENKSIGEIMENLFESRYPFNTLIDVQNKQVIRQLNKKREEKKKFRMKLLKYGLGVGVVSFLAIWVIKNLEKIKAEWNSRINAVKN